MLTPRDVVYLRLVHTGEVYLAPSSLLCIVKFTRDRHSRFDCLCSAGLENLVAFPLQLLLRPMIGVRAIFDRGRRRMIREGALKSHLLGAGSVSHQSRQIEEKDHKRRLRAAHAR
jgi:hypothetical protein